MSEALRENPAETAPAQDAVSAEPETPAQPQLPMRWHGFMCRFMLWAAAALHLVQTALLFTGMVYYKPGVRDAVYAGMPAMRWLDWALAAALALASVMLICAAVRLIRRRAAGVISLRSAYIVLAAAWFVYGAARFLLAGLSPLSLPVAGRALSCLALLLVNNSYYRKRSGMFEE